MKIKKLLSVYVVGFLFVHTTIAGIMFDNLALNDDNQLLYSVTHNITGESSYSSLLLTSVNGINTQSVPKSKILTCYPDEMELLDNGSKLQIRNRYGTGIYDISSDKFDWKTVNAEIPTSYKQTPVYSVSPNGKWICYVEQSKNSNGKLILVNTDTGQSKILNDNTSFYLDKVNVRWSFNSQHVLYESNGYVYFVSPDVVFKNMQLPDDYCRIGRGTINSVQWTKTGSLIYVDTDIVYVIQEKELYTRGLYSDLAGTGVISGRLNFCFNPYQDSFWVDAAGSRLIVINDNKIVCSYLLNSNGYEFLSNDGLFSLTSVKGCILDYNLFWTNENKPMLWLYYINYDTGKKMGSLYSVSKEMKHIMDVANPQGFRVSPSSKYIALATENNLYVYESCNWKLVSRLTGEKVTSYIWNGDSGLFVGSSETVKYWPMQTNLEKSDNSRVIVLSAVYDSAWVNGQIVARTKNNSKYYVYDADKGIWKDSKTSLVTKSACSNKEYRVYLDDSKNSYFENAIYVRAAIGPAETYVLNKETQYRIPKQKKIALVFDAFDNADGLAKVFVALQKFDLKCTFFINGEFIRRYPKETAQIAASYPCASSFYSSADLFESNFIIDADFIKKGLARNEDLFYSVTGKELSLYWHAPYYKSNDMVKNAGSSSGYKYIDRDIALDDRSCIEQAKGEYYSVDYLIDRYVGTAKDGDVIAVSVGKVNGTRSEYIYDKIDLLISSLLNNGYSIVDISSLN